jgi:hypothetical protein
MVIPLDPGSKKTGEDEVCLKDNWGNLNIDYSMCILFYEIATDFLRCVNHIWLYRSM